MKILNIQYKSDWHSARHLHFGLFWYGRFSTGRGSKWVKIRRRKRWSVQKLLGNLANTNFNMRNYILYEFTFVTSNIRFKHIVCQHADMSENQFSLLVNGIRCLHCVLTVQICHPPLSRALSLAIVCCTIYKEQLHIATVQCTSCTRQCSCKCTSCTRLITCGTILRNRV